MITKLKMNSPHSAIQRKHMMKPLSFSRLKLWDSLFSLNLLSKYNENHNTEKLYLPMWKKSMFVFFIYIGF